MTMSYDLTIHEKIIEKMLANTCPVVIEYRVSCCALQNINHTAPVLNAGFYT